MTVDEFKQLELPVESDCQLYVETGLEWLQAHTKLSFDPEHIETIKALPSSAKLFLVKFCDICKRDIGVMSESVGPISQSFSSDSSEQTAQLARQLLKSWLKPNVIFIPCRRRWY